jgi:hypothetical protein
MAPASARILKFFLGILALFGGGFPGDRPAAILKAPVDVFTLMEEVRTLETKPLWPGFEPEKIPAAIFDGENTYLFGFPRAPQGFGFVPERPEVFVFAGQHPSVRANRRVEIEGVRAAACLARFAGLHASVRDLAATIIHEKFHVFQAVRHPNWRPNDALLFNYPADTSESVLARRLEVEALKRAVAAKDPEETRGWAALSLRYHRERLTPLSRDLARYEEEIQCLEGLAEYVEWQVIGRGLFERYPDLDFAPSAIRSFGYLSGRWIGVVLDRLDPEWKKDLESGVYAHPRERLAQVTRGAETRSRFSASEIAAWRTRAETDLKARRVSLDEARRNFLARPGWRVVIDAGRKPLRLRFFLANEAEAFSEREMLHHRWLALANEDCDLEVVGREALTESDGATKVVRITIPGFAERPEVADEDGRHIIRGSGVVLRFPRSSLSEDRQTLTIRLDFGEARSRPPVSPFPVLGMIDRTS